MSKGQYFSTDPDIQFDIEDSYWDLYLNTDH